MQAPKFGWFHLPAKLHIAEPGAHLPLFYIFIITHRQYGQRPEGFETSGRFILQNSHSTRTQTTPRPFDFAQHGACEPQTASPASRGSNAEFLLRREASCKGRPSMSRLGSTTARATAPVADSRHRANSACKDSNIIRFHSCIHCTHSRLNFAR